MADQRSAARPKAHPGSRLLRVMLIASLAILAVSTGYFVGESFGRGDSTFSTVMAAAFGAATVSLAWLMVSTWRIRRPPR